ncbi:Tn3 family transposase, partial [Salmonella enterica subsp. enterica serovar Typhimurium]|nr:Tn3 family transposase [Salmonella enterica subsp. enterica serovar Typhimurium]
MLSGLNPEYGLPGGIKALREIGRIERTLFMLDWFRDP